jgi:hypothetical protein
VPARYRCNSCGNLTRFDVTVTSTVRAFHHYSVGGELTVEESEVVAERVDSVECRWCGPSGVIEELAEPPVTPPA